MSGKRIFDSPGKECHVIDRIKQVGMIIDIFSEHIECFVGVRVRLARPRDLHVRTLRPHRVRCALHAIMHVIAGQSAARNIIESQIYALRNKNY